MKMIQRQLLRTTKVYGKNGQTRSFAHRVNMILKQDVEKLGTVGDEVKVRAGYARNYLYPEKLAVYATPTNIEKFKVSKGSIEQTEVEKDRELIQIIKRISSVEVVFKRHTPSESSETLHSSVTAENISDMLEKQHGIIVGVARIELPTPLKRLGNHTVSIRVDDHVQDPTSTSNEDEQEKKKNNHRVEKKKVDLNILIIKR